MQTVTCPIDNNPCEPGCPDRYQDVPEGGCILTTAIENGATVLLMLENTKEAAPGAANTGSGRVEMVLTD